MDWLEAACPAAGGDGVGAGGLGVVVAVQLPPTDGLVGSCLHAVRAGVVE